MARVRSFTQASSSGSPHPTETDAQWSVVRAGEASLLQVSTFGSDVRVSQPKVSQTLQFDRSSAALLKQAIEAAFPGL
ncbi:hypothetical protein GCM10027416_19560 [Okibacterium endophyticum]